MFDRLLVCPPRPLLGPRSVVAFAVTVSHPAVGVTVVDPAGELALLTSPILDGYLECDLLEPRHTQLILEVTHLGFRGVAGLRSVLSARELAQNRHTCLYLVSGPLVGRLLYLTDLRHQFVTCADVTLALANASTAASAKVRAGAARAHALALTSSDPRRATGVVMGLADSLRPTTDGRSGDTTGIAVTLAVGSGASRRRGSDYAQLSREVRAAGLLARRPGYYRARIGLTLALWAAGWTVFALLGRSWWQLAVAGFLAVMFAQVGFLGHDAGHRQVFTSRRANDGLGLVCANLLIGLSYGWWTDKHNRHHAHPNQVDRDPDIAGAGIAFTPAQAAARHSAVGRWIARHQAGLFFPMLMLEGLSLHGSSIRALFEHRAERNRAWWRESVLLGGHFGGYLAAVFLVLPVGQAVAFLAVHQCLLGVYLGCSFAPGHKGMPLLRPGEELGFLQRQVLTSRNIRGGRWLEVVMGGLNYQIEHHLFPSMPSPSLRRAQPLVRTFCGNHHLPYHESALVGSYAQVLRYLHDTGAETGKPRQSQ